MPTLKKLFTVSKIDVLKSAKNIYSILCLLVAYHFLHMTGNFEIQSRIHVTPYFVSRDPNQALRDPF